MNIFFVVSTSSPKVVFYGFFLGVSLWVSVITAFCACELHQHGSIREVCFHLSGQSTEFHEGEEKIWHNWLVWQWGLPVVAEIGCVLKKTGQTMEVVLDLEAGRME
jgi:hypothetical protein